MKKAENQTRWLAGVSGIGLALLMPQAAMAQAADGAPAATAATDDIVITGVKAAIFRGLENKRLSDSIIDSISAEDIGKFPDRNIAEAIQRIPGVSIDRTGGEGRYITINGLGPELSLTLFNGRQIASADPGRSFSFDTIASDLVRTLNVYKTANADIPEGGLGGTVDVRTARPFDLEDFTASIQASVNYDGNSKDAYPQVSAIISKRFLEGRLGVLLSFTHQKRHNKTYQTLTSGWSRNYFVDPVSEAYVDDEHEDAWRNWSVDYGTTDTYRERNGGTAVVQFEATDTLTLTADYLYSKFNVKDVTNSGGAYLWAVQNSPGTVIDDTGSYHQLDVSGGHNLGSFSFTNSTTYRPTTTQLAGLNAEWKPTDRLTGNIDVYWSKAVNNNRGDNQSQTLEMLNQPGYIVSFPDKGVPVFDLLGQDVGANEQALRARQVRDSGTYTNARNYGLRADFAYEWTPDLKLKFGGSYGEQRKSNTYYETPTPITRMYHKNAEGQEIDTASIISGVMTANGKYGLENGATFPIFQIDSDALRSWMADPVNLANRTKNANAGGLAEFIANGRTWDAQETSDSFSVKEKDLSLYGSVDAKFDLGSIPVTIVAGLRYSRTHLISSGTSRVLVGFTRDTYQLLPLYASAGSDPVSETNTYNRFLPSVNAKFDLMDDLVARIGVTKTLSRPTLEDLAPAITYGGMSYSSRNATGSNPFLKPFTSWNIDASLEYYYSRKGAIAVAGFHKDAKDFIVRSIAEEKITSIASVPEGVDLTLDELQTFRVNRPRNAASAKIDGITASWTHAFDFGLGFQANYTKVWSSTSVDEGSPPFAVPGVSDTANIVGFFERGPVSARIAYNWRSSFLIDAGLAGEQEPTTGDAYHQIDARIGLDVGWGINLGLDVINLTNEKVRYHARYDNQFVSLRSYGRQFMLSASKKF